MAVDPLWGGRAKLKLAVCLPFNVIAGCSAEAGQSRMDDRGKAEVVQMFNQ
jgi:hypothetical protein